MKLSLLAIATLVLLASCGPGQVLGPTLTPTPTPTFTPTSTPTLTPTPTEIPVPQGLKNVPEGYAAVRNPDGTWGYGVGADAKTSVPGLTVDASGAHFRLEGTTVDIPVSEIKDRVQVGQEGALQIYDLDEYGVNRIQFAWDTKQEKWIRATDIRQPWRELIYDYITVQTREQLAALFDLEPLVMSPFPPDTYFPPLDKVIVNYQGRYINYDTTLDFNYLNPFGKVTDIEKSPFRFVNFILLEKGEGRKFDTYIVTEQVYNPADGTFSLLHFGLDNFAQREGFLDRGLSTLLAYTEPPYILLPGYAAFEAFPFEGYEACSATDCNQMQFFIEHNYFNPATGRFPEIQQMIEAWLTFGKVPDEMERFVYIPFWRYIMTPPQ